VSSYSQSQDVKKMTASIRAEMAVSRTVVNEVASWIYIYIYIYILITIKVSKMTKVTSQALYKTNIEIKEKKKKINESSDDF